jgi:polyisoprenoid-binding protein YceI
MVFLGIDKLAIRARELKFRDSGEFAIPDYRSPGFADFVTGGPIPDRSTVLRMTPVPGTYEVGPSNGSLHLRTAREGMAAKVGHDLLIKVARWSGTAKIPDSGDLSTASLEVRIDLDSLEVVEGSGGVSPLDAGDKADILKNAGKTLDVARYPTAEFTATALRPNGDGGEIEGTLNLAGASGTVTLSVTANGGSVWKATGTVVQSQYGIKPYKAFMGALRMADPVRVEAEVSLDQR